LPVQTTEKNPNIINLLNRFGYVYLADKVTFIIQDHIILEQLFKEGNFQEHYFKTWMKSLNPETIVGEREGKKDSKNLRFLIDPHQ
jgi:hypothetical protein